jgi:hypothetical protein
MPEKGPPVLLDYAVSFSHFASSTSAIFHASVICGCSLGCGGFSVARNSCQCFVGLKELGGVIKIGFIIRLLFLASSHRRPCSRTTSLRTALPILVSEGSCAPQ